VIKKGMSTNEALDWLKKGHIVKHDENRVLSVYQPIADGIESQAERIAELERELAKDRYCDDCVICVVHSGESFKTNRDELGATVERLLIPVKLAAKEQTCSCDESYCNHAEIVSEAIKALAATPAQNLAAIEARVWREAAKVNCWKCKDGEPIERVKWMEPKDASVVWTWKHGGYYCAARVELEMVFELESQASGEQK